MASSATVGILRVLLTASSAEFEAAMKRSADTAKTMSRELNRIGDQATQIGKALTTGITLPLVGLAAASIKAAMNFESSFANVAKTVDGISDKFGKLTPKGEKLAQTFRQMAKEIPATTDELNAIAAMGGQMGVPIDQLEHFTRNVAALGVAVDGISAQDAAASLAAIGNATGTGTTKIQQMASALVHLGNNSNATEADILEFTKRLIGAGHAAGMTVPEVMAIGTAMANVGIQADAGGTAMSTVIAKIGKAVSLGSSDLEEFAKVAGKTADEFATIWKRSSAEGIELFVKGLGTMKARGVDLNLTMGELGTEGIRVASTLKLLAGAGDDVSKMIALANEGFAAGNKHLEEAQKKYATTANQLKILWNQIKDVGITIGNALLPGIKSMISVMSGVIPIIDKVAVLFSMLPGPLQALIVGTAALVAAVGPLLLVFGALTRATGDIVAAFGKQGIATRALTLWNDGLTTSSGRAATALGLLGKAAAVAAAAFVGWQIGRVISDLFGLDQKIADTLTHLDALQKVRGQTAAGGESGRTAATGALAQKERELAEAIRDGNKALASRLMGEMEAIRNDQTRLAILDTINNAVKRGADANISYADAVKFLAAKEQERLASLKATTDEQQRTGKSTEALKGQMSDLAAKLKEADSQIAQLSDSARKDLAAAIKSGAFEMKDLEKSSGLSEIALKRFKEQMQDTATATKAKAKEDTAAEKAAAKHAAAIAKQADALEKLGVVTENQVLKSMAEFGTLVKLATDAGVPLDKVLLALAPHLEALKVKADASGVSMQTFGSMLDETTAASKRMLDDIVARSRPAVVALGELPGTLVKIDGAADIARIGAQNLAASFQYFGVTSRSELQATARAAIAHYKEISKSAEATPEAIAKALAAKNAAIVAAGGKVGSAFIEGFEKDLERIPDIVVGALVGGGGMKGAVQAIGSMLGADLGKKLGESLGKNISGLSQKWGGLIGGAFGSVLGPLLGGLVDKLFGSAGRDSVKTFAASMGGFDALRAKLAPLGAEGERLWITLTQGVGRNNPAQAKAAIDAITKALDTAAARTSAFNDKLGSLLQRVSDVGSGLPESLREYVEGLKNAGTLTQGNIDLLAQLSGNGEADWKKIQEAVQRYGGDISKLGGSFQAQRLHEGWQQIIDDLDLFERGNISAGDALELTKGKINELVNESRRFGTDIPENMRPWIQKMIDAGELVDDTGEKITDIGKLKFGETLQTSLQILTQTIKDLIEEFKKVPGAVAGIPKNIDTTVTVRRKTVDEDSAGPEGRSAPSPVSRGGLVTSTGIRYLASGGLARLGSAMSSYWKPRGTDTVPALLTPKEGVVNTTGMGILGADGLSALNHGVDLLRAGAMSSGVSTAGAAPVGARGGDTYNLHVHGNVDSWERAKQVVNDFVAEVKRGGNSETRVLGALGLSS